MKSKHIFFLLLMALPSLAYAGFSFDLKDLKNTAKNLLKPPTDPTEGEMGFGLKEALQKGIELSAQQAHKTDGFLKNDMIKILLPPEAKKAEELIRKIGMGHVADKALTSMNRAAEDAAISSIPIFTQAIKEITFQDVVGILKGGENAATNFLKAKTSSQLISQFKPNISTSLDKVDATKYWKSFASTYNKIPLQKKMEVDLAQHVSNGAVNGLFTLIAQEEVKIRKDPAARTSELLKKVFEYATKK
ncbi:MAG: DUF4197 domain-containing protein [Bdellovibrionaceae bacterium]|nr:DUF4197 domain-containing protein [Pseudobdellovibrionaceae bacterium]